VRVEVELLLDRLDHVGMAVTGVEHGDAAGKVHVSSAFHIPHFRILPAGNEDLMGMSNAAWYGGLAPCE
jgi:hypothetical protein